MAAVAKSRVLFILEFILDAYIVSKGGARQVICDDSGSRGWILKDPGRVCPQIPGCAVLYRILFFSNLHATGFPSVQ